MKLIFQQINPGSLMSRIFLAASKIALLPLWLPINFYMKLNVSHLTLRILHDVAGTKNTAEQLLQNLVLETSTKMIPTRALHSTGKCMTSEELLFVL